MKKVMYHATDYKNLGSIMARGIHKGIDGCVYLCDRHEDAVKFVYLHGIKKVLVVAVNIEEDLLEESFDYSEAFFKCKAYTIYDNISSDDIDLKLSRVYDFD